MLNDSQYKRTWDHMLGAEVRAFYFAEMTDRCATLKRAFTFLTFLLSSGAAATITAKLPALVPIILSLVTAAITAYSVAVDLDGRVKAASKLHETWSNIAFGFDDLRGSPDASDADEKYQELMRRDLEASVAGTTSVPYEKRRVEKWAAHVYASHGVS